MQPRPLYPFNQRAGSSPQCLIQNRITRTAICVLNAGSNHCALGIPRHRRRSDCAGCTCQSPAVPVRWFNACDRAPDSCHTSADNTAWCAPVARDADAM